MELTQEEEGYDIDALKESIKDCRENKVTYNQIAHAPDATKEDALFYIKRVNSEDDKILKYQRIIDELERRNGDKKE